MTQLKGSISVCLATRKVLVSNDSWLSKALSTYAGLHIDSNLIILCVSRDILILIHVSRRTPFAPTLTTSDTETFQDSCEFRRAPSCYSIPSLSSRKAIRLTSIWASVGNIIECLVSSTIKPRVQKSYHWLAMGNQRIIDKSQDCTANWCCAWCTYQRCSGTIPDSGKSLTDTGNIRISTTCRFLGQHNIETKKPTRI